MPKLPSSKHVIKVLERNGFELKSQRGSHAKYRKASYTVIVPVPRKEIPLGTLRSIARQSGMDFEEFRA